MVISYEITYTSPPQQGNTAYNLPSGVWDFVITDSLCLIRDSLYVDIFLVLKHLYGACLLQPNVVIGLPIYHESEMVSFTGTGTGDGAEYQTSSTLFTGILILIVSW